MPRHRREEPLPAYVRGLLPARLKSVFYYNTSNPTIEIRASRKVEDIVQTSANNVLAHTNTPTKYARLQDDYDLPYIESYRQVNTDEFLAAVDPYCAAAKR